MPVEANVKGASRLKPRKLKGQSNGGQGQLSVCDKVSNTRHQLSVVVCVVYCLVKPFSSYLSVVVVSLCKK